MQLRSSRGQGEIVTEMGQLVFGTLRDAWKGEASDFTPLLAAQVDSIWSAIGVDLAAIGSVKVATDGGRRIDIVAEGADGTTFVIENQYGALDHDHLTRGLAYAVAVHARGLVVIAERHRDEFRAVAGYLNELRDNDPARGVAVWLVEAKAVRIGDSAWAPLFEPVVAPNAFTAAVEFEQSSGSRRMTREDFDARFDTEERLQVVKELLEWWKGSDRSFRIMARPPQVVLMTQGPAVGGWSTVIGVYPNGRVAVPFGAYNGQHSGFPIGELGTPEFRAYADEFFGFDGSEIQARTVPDWLELIKLPGLKEFCEKVADAYLKAKVEYATYAKDHDDYLKETSTEA